MLQVLVTQVCGTMALPLPSHRARRAFAGLTGCALVGLGYLIWLLLSAVVAYFVSAGHSQVPWGEIGRDPGTWFGIAIVGFLVFAGLLGGSLKLVALGGKLRRLGVDAATLSAGEEPVVLYLRSFSLDRTIEGHWSQEASSPVGGARAVFAGTLEERMLRPLRVFGRVLAVGRPGERLPTRGAERVYVGDREWQSTVLDLMSRASLVVIAPDSSPGIRWEVEVASETVPAECLVVILPNAVSAEAEASAMCLRLGRNPPKDARRAFALGFTADGGTEVLLRHPADGAVIVEGLGLALLRRLGLQRLVRREAWGRAVAGLGLLGFFVMVPAALLTMTGLSIAVAVSLGLLLLGAGVVDRRPSMAVLALVGLSLLGSFLLEPSPPAWIIGGGSLVFLAGVVLAYVEAAFTPSGRLVREVRRAQTAGTIPTMGVDSPPAARSRSRHLGR